MQRNTYFVVNILFLSTLGKAVEFLLFGDSEFKTLTSKI